MTSPTQENQAEQTKPNDKELNFRALESKYQKALEQERSARLEAESKYQESQSKKQSNDDDDEDNEPYIDKKKLKKEQAKFGQQLKQETQSEIQKAVNQAIQKERQDNWVKNNPDFYDILQHAEKFANEHPELAETILQMPEGTERQKLVYKNIKALGIHKPQEKQPSIQDKVDANRRSPFYQPGSVGTSPYSQAGNFSPSGQKDAYAKMQELKNRLRI